MGRVCDSFGGWGTAFGMMLITGEFVKGVIGVCLLLAANGVWYLLYHSVQRRLL